METMPLSMIKHMEEDVPPVFMILDTFDKDIKVRLFSFKNMNSLNLYLLFILLDFTYFNCKIKRNTFKHLKSC